jgi:hypothetical protein
LAGKSNPSPTIRAGTRHKRRLRQLGDAIRCIEDDPLDVVADIVPAIALPHRTTSGSCRLGVGPFEDPSFHALMIAGRRSDARTDCRSERGASAARQI